MYSLVSWTILLPNGLFEGLNYILEIVPPIKRPLGIMKPYWLLPVAKI